MIRKVGRGKYSEVFEGVNVINDEVSWVHACMQHYALLPPLTAAPGRQEDAIHSDFPAHRPLPCVHLIRRVSKP